MVKLSKLIVGAVLTGVAVVAVASTPKTATVASGSVLLDEPLVAVKALAQCQPVVGDTVSILGVKNNASGINGLNLAHVRVLDGKCAGEIGWVGMSRLDHIS